MSTGPAPQPQRFRGRPTARPLPNGGSLRDPGPAAAAPGRGGAAVDHCPHVAVALALGAKLGELLLLAADELLECGAGCLEGRFRAKKHGSARRHPWSGQASGRARARPAVGARGGPDQGAGVRAAGAASRRRPGTVAAGSYRAAKILDGRMGLGGEVSGPAAPARLLLGRGPGRRILTGHMGVGRGGAGAEPRGRPAASARRRRLAGGLVSSCGRRLLSTRLLVVCAARRGSRRPVRQPPRRRVAARAARLASLFVWPWGS